MLRFALNNILLFSLGLFLLTPAYASGGGEVLYIMFGAFALLPFAIIGPILAYVGYASAPESEPAIARTRVVVGLLVAYVISYAIIYFWMVGI